EDLMTDATDDFNRGSLGGNWTTYAGSPTLSGTALNAGGYSIRRTAETFGADHYSEIVITEANTNGLCAVVRISDDNNYYYIYPNGSGFVQIWKKVAGGFSSVTSQFAATQGAGTTYRLEATGSTIKMYVNGSLITSQTDTSLTTGGPGIVD